MDRATDNSVDNDDFQLFDGFVAVNSTNDSNSANTWYFRSFGMKTPMFTQLVSGGFRGGPSRLGRPFWATD